MPERPLYGVRGVAAFAEQGSHPARCRDDLRTDEVHDEVAVTLEQRHDAGDPVDDLALRRGAHQLGDAAALTLDDALDAGREVLPHARRVDALGERLHLGLDVVAHPRDGGELHAVRLLVEADPEPEVGGIGLELTLDVHDVGCDEQQPPGRRRERIELAQHLRAHEAEQQPELGAGDPATDGAGRGARCLRSTRDLRHERVQQDGEALGVGLHPATTVDDQHRRGVLRSDQPGELGDEAGRASGSCPELGHRSVGLVPAHGRALAGEPRAQADGVLPVDDLQRVLTHAGKRTRRPVPSREPAAARAVRYGGSAAADPGGVDKVVGRTRTGDQRLVEAAHATAPRWTRRSRPAPSAGGSGSSAGSA